MSELVKVATPVGELHWVNISGQGKLNYNEDGYNYVATIHLKGEEAETLKKKIDDELGEVPKGKTVKSVGYKNMVKDPEGNLRSPDKDGKVKDKEGEDIASQCEPTDIWAFTFTTGTTFADGKTKVINVFNKDAQKIQLGDKQIGNGSKGAISGKMRKFERGKEVGVSLFLNAIQLTSFEAYEGDAGFEAQEGDFDGVSDEETGFETQTESSAKSQPKL